MASTNTSVVQRLEMLEEEDGIGEICGGRGGGGEGRGVRLMSVTDRPASDVVLCVSKAVGMG